jgi:hypothetical protein
MPEMENIFVASRYSRPGILRRLKPGYRDHWSRGTVLIYLQRSSRRASIEEDNLYTYIIPVTEKKLRERRQTQK